jgi:hypothetical protein
MNLALDFVRAWTVRPMLLLPPLLLGLILLGFGKGLGLPRLFWSVRRGEQVRAGFATGFVFYEALLVTALLSLEDRHADLRHDPAVRYVALYALVSSALALIFLITAAVRAHGIRDGVPGRLSPAIRKVHGDHRGERTETGVSPMPFLGGVLGAVVLASGLIAFGFELRALLGSWSSRLELAFSRAQAPELHLTAFLSAFAMLVALLFPRRYVPAAVAMGVLAGLVVAFHGLFSFLLGAAGLELLILAVLLLWGATSRTRIGFADLEPMSEPPKPYPPTICATDLLHFSTALDALERNGGRKLIVICVSGGGIRAATWTAAILRRLDQIEGFPAAARWISGASGGMVGASFWRAAEGKLPMEALVEATAMDSLSPTVRQLVFNDVLRAFVPGRNRSDRGSALQEAWRTQLEGRGINLARAIADMRDSEREGTWPSLVFSPMLVEDGRRLLVTNLNLHQVTDHSALWLRSAPGAPRDEVSVSAETAYALEDICRGALNCVTLATAARMSASFPYVSPATPLPTAPTRRVVDAGYYDNYGVELACSWIRAMVADPRLRFLQRVEKVLVIQIRDNVSELSVNPGTDLKGDQESGAGLGARALWGLTSPLEGILSARESVMLFRNDGQIEALTHALNTPARRDFLSTTAFEFGGEASLGWRLDPDERDLLLDQATSPGITSKLNAVRRWLQ